MPSLVARSTVAEALHHRQLQLAIRYSDRIAERTRRRRQRLIGVMLQPGGDLGQPTVDDIHIAGAGRRCLVKRQGRAGCSVRLAGSGSCWAFSTKTSNSSSVFHGAGSV